MSEAKVDSIEQIKAFKRALWRFAEVANAALSEAEADAQSTLRWLENDQRSYWALNVRKSQELVSRCEEALRHKRLFKDASGRIPSAVDEEKALQKAKRQLEYAQQRVENVKRYTPRLQREIMLYKGQVQKLSTFVAADIPAAAGKLDKIVETLDAYVNVGMPTEVGSGVSLPSDAKAQPSDEAAAPAEVTEVTEAEGTSPAPAESNEGSEQPSESNAKSDEKVEPS